MLWRCSPLGRLFGGAGSVPAEALAGMAAIRCRHCGGARLKLSYRRRDKSPTPGAEAGTTFILRCPACEQFTTVVA